MIFMIHTIIYIDGVLHWLTYNFFFFSFHVLLMLVYCWASVTDGGPAINQQLLLELCQCRHVPTALDQRWDNAGNIECYHSVATAVPLSVQC